MFMTFSGRGDNQRESNRLGILVADVSGHGVNSAMLSGMVKALAAPLSLAVLEPGEMLAGPDVSTEQYFPECSFCTGFYLIADEETGLVRYAGVGHPPAIIVGPAGSRMLPSNPGMLGIGMVDGTAGGHDTRPPRGSRRRPLRRGSAQDSASELPRFRSPGNSEQGRRRAQPAHDARAPRGRHQHHRSPATGQVN